MFLAVLLALGAPARATITWSLSPDGTYRISSTITEADFVSFLNDLERFGGPSDDPCNYFQTAAMTTNGVTRTHDQFGDWIYSGGSSSPMQGMTLHAAMAYANWLMTGNWNGGYYDLDDGNPICGYGANSPQTPFPERCCVVGTLQHFWLPDYDQWQDSVGGSAVEVTDTYLGSGGYKTSQAATIGIATGATSRGLHVAADIIDADGDGHDDVFDDNCPTVSNSNQADADSDGIGDACDKCKNDARNAVSTCDSDNDGYGNPCDPDFDQNKIVNSTDFGMYFIPAYNGTDPAPWPEGMDMDCNGIVNSTDNSGYFAPIYTGSGVPGPSGLGCAGTVPCP